MAVASLLLNVLGPVVVLVVLGALVGGRLDVDRGTLSRMAYWLFGPAFVFEALAGADLDRALITRLAATGLAGMAAALVASAAMTRLSRVPFSVAAATMMTSAYGNVGNAGLAISVFAFGDDALGVAGVMMLTINMTGMILGVGLAGFRSGSVGAGVREAFLAPLTIAGLAAAVMQVSGIDVPLIIERSIGLLAAAMIPVMLLTLGVQLRQIGLGRPTPQIGITLLAKLLIAPAAAALLGRSVGLTGDAFGVAVIQSAMPPAVFCALVAMEHDLEPERVTAALVTATAASILTLPLVLALVT